MRAAVLEPGGRFAVKDVPEPVATGSQAVLRVTYCGICGSDLHAIRAGAIPSGAVLGHEIVGEIVALGPDARGFEVGDRVTTLSALPCDSCSECRDGRFRTCTTGWQIYGYASIPGGYAEYVLSHVSVMEKVPAHLSDESAAFNEPAIVGLHAVRDSCLRLGDTSVIIGAGPIGLLVLQSVLLANAGPLYVIEPSEGRRRVAMQLGATAALHPGQDEVARFLQERTEIGPDVVFECAGARGTLQTALDLVRPGGQVMVPGVNMEEDEVNPLTMIGKECEIRGALGGAHLFRTALDYLAEGRIRVDPMLSRIVGLDEVDSVCQSLGTATSDDVKVLVAPGK